MRVRSAWILGAILLAGSIGASAWYLNRPVTEAKGAVSPESLDVVCRGRVDAEGLVYTLDPPLPGGRVVALHVKEGAEVKKGQPIATIDDRAYVDAVGKATVARDLAKIELEVAQAKEKAHPAEIEALQKEIDAAATKADGGEAKLRQMRLQKSLSDSVPVTKADIDAAEAELRGARLKLEAEQIRLDQLKKVDPSLAVRAAQLQFDAANVQIKEAERYRDDCVIRAPVDGTIVRMQTAVGTMLAPASPLLDPAIIFAPAGGYVVRAELDQADLGRVSVGMAVKIMDDARHDSPTWTGRVTEISKWVAPKRKLLLDPGEFNDVRTTEAIIKLDPSTHPLWIGQRMVVRIGKGS